jgi:hypothetical protein
LSSPFSDFHILNQNENNVQKYFFLRAKKGFDLWGDIVYGATMVKLPPLEDDTMPGPPKKRGEKKYGVRTTREYLFARQRSLFPRRFVWTRWYHTKPAQSDAYLAAWKSPYVTSVEKVLR